MTAGLLAVIYVPLVLAHILRNSTEVPLAYEINNRSFPCSRSMSRRAAAYWRCSPPA